MDHGLHHLIQPVVLAGLAQGDAPVGQQRGQGETPVDLVVEVLGQQAEKFSCRVSRASRAELAMKNDSTRLVAMMTSNESQDSVRA